ncbi:MAG: nucleotide exchange factor GrpE [Methanomassiliicoccales archaeon]|nr:nucleotide exchange factor GrpE [Methanomassiliicoccales archaeon]
MEDSSKDTRPPQAGEAQEGSLTTGEEAELLKKDLVEAKAQAERNLELAKRIQADFDNYKKRTQRDREEQMKAANDKLLYELLGFLDDFERALSSKGTPEELRSGLESIHDNLRSMLQSKGLVETPCETFDPALHEALCVGEGEEGKVLEVYQKGYCLGPRVIRYAKVKVGKDKDRGESDG